MIKWNDKYSAGISIIDEEHKKLIEIINKAITASRHKDNSTEIMGILREMSDFAQTHFATEETYMLECGYPDYEHHKKEHQDFLIETIAFLDDAAKGDSLLAYEVLEHLKVWFVSHIQGTDRGYILVAKRN
ncbi:MAG: hemerythrin family protein [Candidatus Brocadiales bacterium]|nr:hemerythrin family protein [Candidatus Brocadiales bacterium]